MFRKQITRIINSRRKKIKPVQPEPQKEEVELSPPMEVIESPKIKKTRKKKSSPINL